MVVSVKKSVFWVVAPCSLVEVIALIMEAASTSETLVNFYQTTRCNNPEDSHHQELNSMCKLPFIEQYKASVTVYIY
jgi:hypothetical protein